MVGTGTPIREALNRLLAIVYSPLSFSRRRRTSTKSTITKVA
jgi:hypothetical protein